MTLLVLNYHRAQPGADGNSVEMLDAHFEWLADNLPNVLPGDPLPAGQRAVCLMFDGGYFDFYATVFPMLQKHGLKAVLAVAPAVIRDDTNVPAPNRLSVASDAAYSQPSASGFCTWYELEELVRSDHVLIAAHGYTHRALNEPGTDLDTELHVPRTLIGTRLGAPVDCFVFPHGKIGSRCIREAKIGYRYIFANGNATNSGWGEHVLHRISADNLRSPTEPFESGRILLYRIRALWNRLRRR